MTLGESGVHGCPQMTHVLANLNSRQGRIGAAGLAAVVVLGLILAWRWNGAEAPQYRTQAVQRGPLTATVSSSGTLNAVVTVQVGSQVSGQIKELLVDYNTEVEAGQVIARLDPESFETKVAQAAADLDIAKAAVMMQRASLDKAKADVALARAGLVSGTADTAKAEASRADARRELERKAALAAKGVTSTAERDKAQATLEVTSAEVRSVSAQAQGRQASVAASEAAVRVGEAQVLNAQATVAQREAALRQAQVDLDRTIIRAPVRGTVIQRNVDAGQTVAASLQAPVLFTIAENLARMQVETSVDEADVGRVKDGQEATFTVDSFPGQVFKGSVRQVRKAPLVVQNVVTYTVVISADNAELKLLPGMTANVRLITDRRENVLKVPNAALRFRPVGFEGDTQSTGKGGPQKAGNEGRVFIEDGFGPPKLVPVKLGLGDGQMTEVVGGELKEGQTVLVGQTGGGKTGAKPSGPAGPRFGF